MSGNPFKLFRVATAGTKRFKEVFTKKQILRKRHKAKLISDIDDDDLLDCVLVHVTNIESNSAA